MCRLFAAVTAAFSLTACVSMAPFQRDKPIEVDSSGWGTQYRQDGKIVEPFSLLDGLSEDPATREEFGNTKAIHYGSLVLAGVGGYMIGYNSVKMPDETDDQTNSRRANMNTGIGLALVGIGLGVYVGHRVDSAVRTFNSSKGKKPAWRPFFDLDPSRDTAALGLRASF